MNLSTIYRNFDRIYRQRQPSINYRRFDQIYRSASPVHFRESSDSLPTGSLNLSTANRSVIVQTSADNRSIAVRIIVKESSSETSESSSEIRKSSHNRLIRGQKSFHRFDATADLLTESAMTNRPIIDRSLLGNRPTRAKSATKNPHHEVHEGREEVLDSIKLRALRVLRGEKCWLRSDTF